MVEVQDPSFWARVFGKTQGRPQPSAPSIGPALISSASRITSEKVRQRSTSVLGGLGKTSEWQEEAWAMLDLVGEQRFLANTLAGRMSQAALYVGVIDDEDSPGTRPVMTEDVELQRLLDAVGDGIAGQSQIIYRAGVNLFVAGEAWLVGIPPELIPGSSEHDDFQAQLVLSQRTGTTMPRHEDDVLKLIWRMFSVIEVNVDMQDKVSFTMETGEQIEADPDDLYLIRIWRSHPRQAWEADSPTRASLPVLRELIGLTMHISAQLDSRLAGAGVLLFNQSASAMMKRQQGIAENDPRDPLVESLSQAMITPIRDRDSASAVVPLIVTVPDPENAAKYITFSSPLDGEARSLRDEAIRRLALGQDAPPEILLGSGSLNHWGAWLIREDVVKTHLEPPLALICDALTSQFLRPVMEASGRYTPEEIAKTVVWFDTDHLIARPNRTQDAKDLYALGVISDEAVREASGFETKDAVQAADIHERAVSLAVDLLAKAPSLASNPGIRELVAALEAELSGSPEAMEVAGDLIVEDTEGGPPDTFDDPMEVPSE